MRPVSLTMKAFGSFAQETAVPFSEFQNGLYLVVGETGAGKTTVFDAIVFALYGAASGRSRTPEAMHSDYVDKSEDTAVTLTFDHCGRRYTVTRTIHFAKKQKTEGEYGRGDIDALLYRPAGEPVRGNRAVTACCEEILGMNVEQFRKIVMLAQGEFREFMAADAAKKADILGKLFDTARYVRYQNLLSEAAGTLEARRRRGAEALEEIMRAQFVPPAGEDAAQYLPGDPALLAHLDALIAREAAAAEGLRGEKEAAQKSADDLRTRKATAASNNGLLNDLNEKKLHLNALSLQAGEMDALAGRLALAQKALYRARPAEQVLEAARNAEAQTKRELVSLKARVEDLQAAYGRAQARAAGDGEAAARVQALATQRGTLEALLPKYGELAARQAALQAETETTEKLRETLRAAEEAAARGREALDRYGARLKALETAEADAVRTENAHKQAQAAAEEFRGIAAEALKVQKAEIMIAADEAQLRELAAQAAAAEKAYHNAYQAFINGQAGLLAAALETELREQGGAVCPVCRSAFRAGQPHAFAPRMENTPVQEDVDALKSEFDRLEKDRADRNTRLASRRSVTQEQKAALAERTVKLLGEETDPEAVYSGEAREEIGGRLRRSEQQARTAFENARKALLEKDRIKGECERIARECSALAEKAEADKNALAAAGTRAAAAEADVLRLKKDLAYDSRAAAEAQCRALEAQRAALQGEIDARRAALDAAKEKLAAAAGALSGKENDLPKLAAQAEEAAAAFAAALRENGFESAGAYAAALPPAGENAADWLNKRQEALNGYRNDRANTKKRISELEAQTKDLRYTDLQALEASLREALARRDAAEAACGAQLSALHSHEAVRARAAEKLCALRKTEAALARLDALAALAAGVSAEGGKLSFERYVIGAIFREVLEMANRRLDIMSGGRYSLIHTTDAARKNSAAGLETDVLDAVTGRQRPTFTLSGGEAFQVSLSLALGLSDVVQAYAGGVGLDTVFIDEGFGALDAGALDNAVAVLQQLSEGNRLVGIISHVDKLEESIPQKLRVKKTARGSVLESELR